MTEQLYICDHAKECDIDFGTCNGKKPFTLSQLPRYSSFVDINSWDCMMVNTKVKRIPYQEDKMEYKEIKEEYEKLKECSMIEMGKKFQDGGEYCKQYRDAMVVWLDMKYRLNDDIDLDDLISVSKKHGGIYYLAREGFIRPIEPEVFYKVTDKFKYNGPAKSIQGVYMIAKIEPNACMLVGVDNFEYFGLVHKTRVSNERKITQKEFKSMAGSCFEYLTKIED